VEFEMPVGETEFHGAAAMTANERERDHLLARAAELG
jgi:hypothetical protein